METRIELRPQRVLHKPSLKNIKVSKPKKEIKEKEEIKDELTEYILDTPDRILMEWELIEIIVSFLGIVFYDPKDNGNCFYFTSSDIKQYYYEITYQQFDKIYGKNGLFTLLSFRNGVTYYRKEDQWAISSRQFMNQIRKDYQKDVEEYGVDFDKLWRRM